MIFCKAKWGIEEDEFEKAFKQGQAARALGDKMTDNPYDKKGGAENLGRAEAWQRGWRNG
jgi:uncharacterized HAD superfamily protein